MIVVDFMHMAHKIHHDHENVARARAPRGRLSRQARLAAKRGWPPPGSLTAKRG